MSQTDQTKLEESIAFAVLGVFEQHDPNYAWCHNAADMVAEIAVNIMREHLDNRLLGDITVNVKG